LKRLHRGAGIGVNLQISARISRRVETFILSRMDQVAKAFLARISRRVET
jgi:hypothetical protein